MNIHSGKTQKNKSQTVDNTVSQKKSSGESTFQFADNRPEVIAQRKLQKAADNYSGKQTQTIQKKGNKTGLPDNLKTGIENLSGLSMDDVKVHYNSGKPAQLHAHAYTQGTNIHVAPGQEKHLPHEAWHVVQQKQGRVQPTMQMKDSVNINDDFGLEKEADVMGTKVIQGKKKIINKPLLHGIHQKSVVIQKQTTLTYKKDSNIGFNNIIEAVDHTRVPMNSAEKGYAKGNSWSNAPSGSYCNHHIAYSMIKNAIKNKIINKKIGVVNSWYNTQANKFGIPKSEVLDNTGNSRAMVNREIDDMIANLSNSKLNLFYWPNTTGDGRGTLVDYPVGGLGKGNKGVSLKALQNRLSNTRSLFSNIVS